MTRTRKPRAMARRGRTPLVTLMVVIMAVALIEPPLIAGAEVLGGALQRTAAAPAQDRPPLAKPSTFEDLQYGDPAAGIDLVEPPEADAYGGAQLRHPIELPQGRLSWQPQVALAYDSGAGNGWLGEGWDVSLDAIRVPGLGADVSADSISVDTRWGVPRYKGDVESETYVFGGEQLSPTAHQTPQIPRVAERQFAKRVEGDYLRILRHGDSPKNYWWEVHDKIGNKYFYGGEVKEYRTSDDITFDPSEPENNGELVPEATLSDASGNIYWWGLREKFDISTNSVTYFYEKKDSVHPGIGEGTELYLSRINYSGSKLRPDQTYSAEDPLAALPRYGRYDVNFVRETGRPDVTSDATGGGLHVTAERLKRVDITYCPQARASISPDLPTQDELLACAEEPQLVRQYAFDYQTGPFNKSLLRSVGKADNGGSVFATHTFDYYDEVTGGDGYDGFAAPADWDMQGVGRGVGGCDACPLGTLDGSALGASHSLGGDGRLFLGFSLLPIKLLAAGGGVQLGGSNGAGDLELIDIDGDGLPDKVWLAGNQVLYQLNRSGPHGAEAFSDGAGGVDGLDSLGQDSDFFVGAGGEAYAAVIALMFNKTWSFARETTYFSDVNADGRPDLVSDGKVLFNVLEPDGRISFTDDSSRTGVRLGAGVALDPSLVLPDQSETANEQAGQFPKVDTLRRWVAPWDGTVSVLAPVSLVGASIDGARVTMEKFGPDVVLPTGQPVPDPGTVLFDADLPPGVTTEQWPGGTPDVPVVVPVRKGDRLYFRVQPKDNGAGDEVAWDPQISYLGVTPNLDVNGKDVYRYSGSEDFTLAGRPGSYVSVPYDGTVRIQGDVTKSRPTSDDITVLVTHNEVPVHTQTIPATQTGSFAVDLTLDVAGTREGADPPATITPGDRVAMRLAVDTNIDPTGVAWAPTLTYLQASDEAGMPVRTTDQNNEPMMTINPPAGIDIYPLNDLVSPQDTIDLDAGDQRTFWAHVEASDGDVLPARAVVSVKNGQGWVAKQEIQITEALVQTDHKIEFEAPTTGRYWIDVTFEDPRVPERVAVTVDTSPDGQSGSSLPLGHHWMGSSADPGKPDLFPAPYRGWAYAGYNGEGERASANVNEEDLLFDRDDYPSAGDDPGDPNYKNPIHHQAYPFAPDTKSGTWLGPKQSSSVAMGAIFGGPGRASASRIGSDRATSTLSPSDVVPSGASAPAITGTGDVDAFGLGVSAVGVGIGTGAAAGTTRGRVDYLDLNGDAFPDVVGRNIYYTNEVGGLTAPTTGDGDVRLEHGFGQSFGGEGSPTALPVSASGDTNNNHDAGSPSSPSDRAGKGAKGAKSPDGGGGDSAGSGGPGGKGGGADGGGGSKRTKKKAPNGGGNGADPGGGDDNKNDVGADLGINGELTRTLTNSQEIEHTGLAQIVAGDPVEEDLADINGDGLPDRVIIDTDGTMSVALNLGYSFAPEVEWPRGEALEQGESEGISLGISFGFNVDKFGFSGGVNFSKDTSTTLVTWDDMNGDGLPDRLTENSGDLYVAFNTGTGLATPQRWGQLQGGTIAESESVGVGGGADFTVTVGPLCWPTKLCYIDINPGFHVDQGWSAVRTQLVDVDGDGLLDTVSSDASDSLAVRRNATGRTNMLKAVQRPLGASFALEYGREGNTTDHPDSMWVLSKVTTDDGHAGDGADTQVTTYGYEGARFDFAEREDYGFRKVVQTQVNADGSPYRAYEQVFRNGNYYERGLLESETVRDAQGSAVTSTENTHEFVDSSDPQRPVVLTGPDSLTGSVFPRLVRIDEHWHDELGAVAKSKEMNYEYDPRGNIVRTTDRGEPDLPGDDVVSELRFTQCDGPVASGGDPEFPWTQMPDTMIVRSASTILQRREALVECNTASVAEVRDYLTPNGDDPSQVAVTTVKYLPVGGQTSAIIGPGPKQAPDLHDDEVQLDLDTRYGVEYAWDEVGAIPLRTSDSYGLVSTAAWDARMGRLLAQTAPNGGTTSWEYDGRGRLTTVRSPMERTGTPTIAYTYGAEAADPWVLATHIDPANNSTIGTVTILDGLGREIQTKENGTVAGTPQVIVSGAVDYDAFGRVVAEYYPTTEEAATPTGAFSAPRDGVEPTRTTYTIRDRIASVNEPGGRVTTYDHGFASGPLSATMFTVLETDPDQRMVREYTDVRDNVVGVDELHTPAGSSTPQNLFTRYDYDAVARLVTVVDPAGKSTGVGYDLLGRRTSVDNPDTGRTEFRYDLQHNIVGEVTANLAAAGEQTTYEYELTRLKAVRYPHIPANDVTYTYGPPVAATEAGAAEAGRITRLEDGSRTVTRAYDILGEVVEETATMKVKNLSPQTAPAHTYTSRFRYDTWGRILSMTYPDGEVLTYDYDTGGLPEAATGVKDGVTYPYADRVEYDKFGNRTLLSYGNGVLTRTAYDPETVWLSDQLVTRGEDLLSDLRYGYDEAGNVTERNDNRPVPPSSEKGGPSAQTFGYDDLHRLTSATGTYTSPPNKTREYSSEITYDGAGRVSNKTQTDTIDGREQKETTYGLDYEYQSTAPHAPSHLGDRSYSFDANGNVTSWAADRGGARRDVVWDEENRPVSVSDQNSTTDYRYNDDDELAIARGPQGELEFVNDYYTHTNGVGAWKYILIDDVRVATKRVDNAPELMQYFLTSDLLDSVNLVTDGKGQLFENVLYFPSGEIWVREKSNTHRQPHLFAGAYFDEFRSLLQLEARWYDPRDGIMYSPDPVLVGDPEAAVLEPRLLNAYSYAFDNPELFVDDLGEQATNNQEQRRPHFGRPSDDRLPWLKATKRQIETEGRIGQFNSRIKRMERSGAYKQLEGFLEGSMIELEISFDGSLTISPKVFGTSFGDLKIKRKVMRR